MVSVNFRRICYEGQTYQVELKTFLALDFWAVDAEESLDLSCYFWLSESRDRHELPAEHDVQEEHERILEALVLFGVFSIKM